MEECVLSPTDKRVAAYLTPVWGEIPTRVGGLLLSGQALAGREDSRRVERRRESVNSVDLTPKVTPQEFILRIIF
jgi:hypothetical protein